MVDSAGQEQEHQKVVDSAGVHFVAQDDHLEEDLVGMSVEEVEPEEHCFQAEQQGMAVAVLGSGKRASRCFQLRKLHLSEFEGTHPFLSCEQSRSR